jgi:hypothetical protein
MLVPHRKRLRLHAMVRELPKPKAKVRKERREHAEPNHPQVLKVREHVAAAHRGLALAARDREAPTRRAG